MLETRLSAEHAGHQAMHHKLLKQWARVLCGGGNVCSDGGDQGVAWKSDYVGDTLNNFGKRKHVL